MTAELSVYDDVGPVSTTERDVTVHEMHRRLAAHDYPAARQLARAVLARRPRDPAAQEALAECRSALPALCAFVRASATSVPSRTSAPADAITAPQAAVLPLVDGAATLEQIAHRSRLQPAIAYQALFALTLTNVLTIR